MFFEHADQTLHHLDRDVLARFLDLDDLEPAGERRVALKIFLVFGPRRRRDRAQLAPGERRFQQVGGVALPRLPAGADQRVGFVDEQDHRRWRRLDLLDHRFEAVLELALDPRSGLQEAEVQRQQRHRLNLWRHVARGDAKREALRNRCLADAGLAGQDGVVLPASGQDIDDLADFRFTPENRVDLAVPGRGGKVDGELVERLGLSAAGTRGTRLARSLRLCLLHSLGRIGGDLVIFAAQGFDRDLLQLRRRTEHLPGQRFVRKQGA